MTALSTLVESSTFRSPVWPLALGPGYRGHRPRRPPPGAGRGWNGWLFLQRRPAEKGHDISAAGAGRGVKPTNADPSGRPGTLRFSQSHSRLEAGFMNTEAARLRSRTAGCFSSATRTAAFTSPCRRPCVARPTNHRRPIDDRFKYLRDPLARDLEAQVSHADLVHDPPKPPAGHSKPDPHRKKVPNGQRHRPGGPIGSAPST